MRAVVGERAQLDESAPVPGVRASIPFIYTCIYIEISNQSDARESRLIESMLYMICATTLKKCSWLVRSKYMSRYGVCSRA